MTESSTALISDITLGSAAGNIPVLDGSAKLPSAVIPTSVSGEGKVIARYYDEDVAHDTTTTAIPADDTIPQSGEGKVTGLSITTATLASSSNRLRVRVTGVISNSSTNNMVMALFNGGASAVRSTYAVCRTADSPEPLALEYEYAPGATTAVTFTVRYGSDSGTCSINGPASRLYGGSLGWTMIVEEIEP